MGIHRGNFESVGLNDKTPTPAMESTISFPVGNPLLSLSDTLNTIAGLENQRQNQLKEDEQKRIAFENYQYKAESDYYAIIRERERYESAVRNNIAMRDVEKERQLEEQRKIYKNRLDASRNMLNYNGGFGGLGLGFDFNKIYNR